MRRSFVSMKIYLPFLKLLFLFVLSSLTNILFSQNLISFESFTSDNGLPSNQIQCTFQDKQGWIWFGTNNGLSRFDGYDFVNFQNEEGDTTSIFGDLVRTIFEDSRGRLWVGTENGGLNLYHREKEIFTHPYINDEFFKGRNVAVNDILEDQEGNLWMATSKNLIQISQDGHIKEYYLPGMRNAFVRVLEFDEEGSLWIGTNSGLFVLEKNNGQIKNVPLSYKNGESDEIWEIFMDSRGRLEVGTFSNGLFVLDPKTFKYHHIELKPEKKRNETVRSVIEDQKGNYWVGTRGGLYYYNSKRKMQTVYCQSDLNPMSLTNNSVSDIFMDQNQEIWISTRNGVNLLAKSKQVFQNFNAHPSDHSNKYLNSSVIYAFWEDEKGKVWVGTEDGGINIYNPKSGSYEYLVANPKNKSGTLSSNCIKAFQKGKDGKLWVGTFLGGVNIIDLKTGKVTVYSHDANNSASLSDDRVWDFLLDDKGDMWVATSKGLDKFDFNTNSFVHETQLVKDKQVNWIEQDSRKNIWIGASDVLIIYNTETHEVTQFKEFSRSFYEDSKGQYWVGTKDKGIAKYSRYAGPIRYYNTKDGLANDDVVFIIGDEKRKLWMGTSNGLSCFDVDKEVFTNYTTKDGLRNNQFMYGAGYKLKDGSFLFGGTSGYYMFNPAEIEEEQQYFPVLFTDLKLFNNSVKVGDKNGILQKSISETDRLVFHYNQNVFTIGFTALNYSGSKSNLYSYYMEGFDKEWSKPSPNRFVTYTNLNPDDYVFHVKRIIPGSATEKEAVMHITVLPPFWKTLWFRFVILAVIIGLVLLIIQLATYRQRIMSELEMERLNSKRQKEIEEVKMKFFTNISHEIRTPLSLITSPLDKLLREAMPVEDMKTHLQLIKRNTTKLSKLINQLLDFRKLESGGLKINPEYGDLVQFVSGVVESFQEYAKEKKVHLQFHSLKDKLFTGFDRDKMDDILNNLLSNAFKYTNTFDEIYVNLSLVFEENEACYDNNKEKVELVVMDTGKGIALENLDKIFDRFFQCEGNGDKKGTGIGLSYVKELVELQEGTINVYSKQGEGTKFVIRLPYMNKLEDESEGDAGKQLHTKELSVVEDEEKYQDVVKDKILLIVEDNEDLRLLLKKQFERKFTIREAVNGREGLEETLRSVPDLIISDVLMPDMDGYELCKCIKKDERISHVPVVLLTALHSKEHELEGLACGADDYITKPFDLQILEKKIDNILSLQKSIQKKYAEEMTLQPSNVKLDSPDEKFLQKAVKCIEKNIANQDLDIESFAKEIGVSRMQLYRKMDALTNMTVKEFIRSIRLKRAAQLLEQEKITINEIVYEVGFKDVSHFRKCFRNMYGMSASEYRKKHCMSIKQ